MGNILFKDGWWINILIYAGIYYTAVYFFYKIGFRFFMGRPSSYTYEDVRFWRRKAQFTSAVICAPLFEEVMFTWLCYSSFLHYAQPGKEGIVLLLVAAFFAILHFPGDWRHQQNSGRGIRPTRLLEGQFSRFFYSLSAYFIFLKTGNLWASILLHYFVNAMASFYNFDVEDGVRSIGSINFLGFLILVLEVGFGIFSCYSFHLFFPALFLPLCVAALVFITLFLVNSGRIIRI